MISPEEARARVGRGATHLDTVQPGWHDRIDIGILEMASCKRCIVGQLCHGFYRGLDMLVIDDPHDFGFSLHVDREVTYSGNLKRLNEEWQPLADAWIAAIADRKLQSQEQPVREEVPCSV